MESTEPKRVQIVFDGDTELRRGLKRVAADRDLPGYGELLREKAREIVAEHDARNAAGEPLAA